MLESRRERRRILRGSRLVIGAFALVAVFVVVSTAGLVAAVPPPPPTYTCSLGSVVTTVQLWTPIVMTNSPYLGSSTGSSTTTVEGSFTIFSGPLELKSTSGTSNTGIVSASNGAAKGLFRLDTWTIYNAVRVVGYPSGACTQPYVARITTPGNQYTGAITLVDSGSTNDASEKTSFTYNGYRSMTFRNGYYENDGAVQTCGTGDWDWVVSQTTSTSISVEISATLSTGKVVSVSGKFGIKVTSGSTTTNTFTYHIPGNSGTYYYGRLNGGGVGPINGALAWRQVPCGVTDDFETTSVWQSAKTGGTSFRAAALWSFSTSKSMSPTHSITAGFTGGGSETDYGSVWNTRYLTMSRINRITIAYYDSLYSHDGSTWDSMYAGVRIRLYTSGWSNYATYEYWMASWYQGQDYKTPTGNAISISGRPAMNTWLILDRNPNSDWSINWSTCTYVGIELFTSAAGTVNDRFQLYFDDMALA